MPNKNIILTGKQFSQFREYWLAQSELADVEFRFNGNKGSLYDRYSVAVDLPLTEASCEILQKITRGKDLEIFIVLMAAWQLLLARYGRQEYIVIHTPLLNDIPSEEIVEPVVAMAALVSPCFTVKELINASNTTVTSGYKYKNYPLSHLNENNYSKLGSNVLITFDAIHMPFPDREAYDLIIDISKRNEGGANSLALKLSYNPGLFDRWFIERIASHYNNILSGFASFNTPVQQIAMLGSDECKMILEGFNNNKVSFPVDQTITDLFELQAAIRPDALAVVAGERSLTYDQLNQRANQLGRLLRNEYQIKKGDIVGIMLDRSEWMIIAILGVLKAGAAYLPVEPGYPQERIRYMLTNAQVQTLIVQAGHMLDMEWPNNLQLLVTDLHQEIEESDTGNISGVTSSSDCAYVIYTSGSTGHPKAVPVSHKALLNTQYWRKDFYAFDHTFSTLQFASFSFDSSVNDIFSMLLWGGKLVILDNNERSNIFRIRKMLKEHTITNFNVVPSLYKTLIKELDNDADHLRIITLAGEKLGQDLVKAHFEVYPNVSIVNEYGPTENAICSTAYKITASDVMDTIIGKPVSNTQVYVLDLHMQPMPVGTAGEICLSGAGLTNGYLHNPDLSAERFVMHPFNEGKKMYLTGDIGRWLPDGRLEFLGRKDDQVKIRGYRVEPGEIEKLLLTYPAVDSSVVVAHTKADGTIILAAYITGMEEADLPGLREYVKHRLPDYMVPAHYIFLSSIPLTPNNKIDRSALQLPDSINANSTNYKAPGSEIEKLLAAAWEEVLGKHPVSVTDDFFACGGDSIKAIQIAARMYKAGYQLEIRQLFENPVISDLALLIEPVSRIPYQDDVTGNVLLTPIQQEIFLKPRVAPHHYNQSLMLSFAGKVTRPVIETIFRKIQEHHDALRMTFTFDGNGMYQHNNGLEHPFSLQEWEIAGTEDEILQICNAIQREIDLGKGPLMRLGLMQTGNHSLLFIVVHHLVMDAISWRILFEDIETLYHQINKGEALVLPPKTDSFKWWSEKLTEYAASNKLLEEKAYWLKTEAEHIRPVSCDFNCDNNFIKDTIQVTCTIPEQETTLLLTKVNAAFNTEINDILLSALSRALSRFTGQNKVFITLEGHGREQLFNDVEISRTVGWFTSTYPVVFDVSGYADLASQVVEAKECLRRVPNKGIGYGILKYLSPEGAGFSLQPEISFNYLGQFEAGASNRVFDIVGGMFGDNQCVDEQRQFIIEVTGFISDKVLTISFAFNKNHFKTETIQRLCDDFKSDLTKIISFCASAERTLTPGDLTWSNISVAALSVIRAKYDFSDIYPLSPMQEGLLFHYLLKRSSHAYFEQVSYRLNGSLLPELVEKSLNELFKRHDVLRTAFVNDIVDRPLQVLLKERKVDFAFYDLSALSEEDKNAYILTFREQDIQRSFDLANDSLLRVALLQLQPREFEFVFSHHHIIMDGWCMGVLIADYFSIYQSLAEGRPYELQPVKQYRDYISWLMKQEGAASEKYWRTYLSEYDEIATIKKGHADRYEKKQVLLRVGKDRMKKLNELVRSQRVTINTLVQTLWGILLSRYNGNNDVVFGSVVSGRPANIAGIESMIGLFINTIPVRIAYNTETKLSDLLQIVQQDALKTEPHHHYPLAEIQAASELKQGLFDHILIFENFPIQSQIEGEVSEVSNVSIFEQTNYDLNIMVYPGDELLVVFNFNDLVFDSTLIGQVSDYLSCLIDESIENADVLVTELNIISADALNRQIASFNNTKKPYKHESLIHELFEEKAELDLRSTAIIYEGDHISYANLNEVANQLAHYLMNEMRVLPGDLVGLMCDRSPWLLINMLAIMKCGAAYLPLDPAFPLERLQYIVEDSGIRAMLRHSKYAGKGIVIANTIIFDRINLTVYANAGNPPLRINSRQPAYMMYTSGSTGKPKGVSISHRSVVNLLTDISQLLDVKKNNTLLAVTTYSFDISLLELFVPLVTGSRLLLTDQSVINDAFALQELMEKEKPDIMQGTPSLWSMLTDAGWGGSSKMKVLCGGERLTEELGKKLLKRCGSLYNMYGPTETTIWSAYKCIKGEEDLHTIGQPLANTYIYIADSSMRLLPPGILGNLYIGGDGLSLGYHNRESLNADRFVNDPFSGEGLIYKTGDLARWLPNGDIEFLGRTDDQVKIRGYRVEPGEAEDALLKHSLISEAIVAVKNMGGDDQLIGYYKSEAPVAAEELHDFLRTSLPEYMIPSFFIPVDAFPQTPNGKIDRKALPLPVQRMANEVTESFSADPFTKKLVAIWQKVLEREVIDPTSNFFALGGHSLKATRLMSAIYKDLNVRPGIKTIFTYPVFNDFCTVVRQLKIKGNALLIPLATAADNYVLSPVQENMWLMDQFEAGREAYLIPAAFALDGKLSVDAFLGSLNALLQRHEIIRTVFVTINGEPRQKILPYKKLTREHHYIDLHNREDKDRLITELAIAEASEPMDLEKGPLFRFKLLCIGEEKHLLFLTMHHIITDDWSMEIMMNELSVLYEAFSNNRESALTPLRIQYKDYANWQYKLLQEDHDRHLQYWMDQFTSIPAPLNLRAGMATFLAKTSRAEEIAFTFDKAVKKELEALSAKNGATTYMTFLALLNTFLASNTGQTDIVIGSPFAGREHPDLENQVGPYINTLAVRTSFSVADTFDALIKRVRENWLEAVNHGMFPIDKLVTALRTRNKMMRASLYDVGFTWHNTTGMSQVKVAEASAGIVISSFPAVIQHVKTDCWFHAWDAEDEIRFTFLYNKELYSEPAMTAFINDLKLMAAQVKHNEVQTIQDLIQAVQEINRKKAFMGQQDMKAKHMDKFFGIPGEKNSAGSRSRIREYFLQDAQSYPLVIQSQIQGQLLNEWIKANVGDVKTKLLQNGAVLLRGFQVNGTEEFREGAMAFSNDLMNYVDQSSPRSLIGERLYTSTDHPADQVIHMHSELSYSQSWPLQIMFHCVQPAETGGETPICDTRSVLNRLSAKTKERFAEKGILYVRNIREGFGLSWQEVYQTEDKQVVEEYCNRHQIQFNWISDKHLTISWSGTAISEHPVSGEQVWFNHGFFFNEHSLHHTIREVIGDREHLPFNTFYGDGMPIPHQVIEEIRQAFDSTKVAFAWEKGDVLLLDNMLMCHGRHAFTGNRKVVVAMANACSSKTLNEIDIYKKIKNNDHVS